MIKRLFNNHKKFVYVAVFLIVVLSAVFIARYFFDFDLIMQQLVKVAHIFSSRESLLKFVNSYGSYAEIVYILLQALQVIVAPFPGELTGSIAGFLFGGLLGTLYATIGLSLGSAIAFILGRFVGLPLIRMMVTEKQMQRFSFVGEKKQGTIVLIVFFIPGFPKDALTYLFSLSRIGFWKFFFLSQIGRLPGTILLTFGASAIFEKNWMMLHLVIWLSLALLLLAFWKRKALLEWLRQ